MRSRMRGTGSGALAVFCAFALALAVVLSGVTAHADPAQRVYVGVYLHDVTKFDQKDGVFDVDIELWVKWFGEFDASRVTIANAATVERTLIAEESDGAWHSTRWRVRGTLRGEFPLHRFPFDAQTLTVTLELPDRYGDLVPDLAGSGMREHFGITGWNYDPWFRPNVSRMTYRSDLGSIESEGRPTTVHRVSFEVVLRRPMVTVGLKFFLPLLVILLVALIALFLPADRVDARSGIGVTALLSTFAFQFAIADTMPDVTYLTVADVMFMVSYGLVAALLALSIVSFFLDSKGRPGAARRLDRIARLVVPVLGITPAIVLARAPRPPVFVHAPAPRPATRHATSRDVLRVGLFGLTGTTSGMLFPATHWSCLRRGADGVRRPVLAEEAPSISNDSLHFLAGGTFEVTWRLRRGLRWSDGAPMVADDLVFAEHVAPDPHTLSVSTADPLTAVMRYDDRIASLLDDFTPLPHHALEAVFRRGGYEAVREYRRTHPVPTSGPYRLAEFVASDHAVLEANPYFFGGPPAIRRIELLKKYFSSKIPR
ncbi:MAG: ABC transporter substrate-binding protein, partial [Deltaproteobacteria bacterium]